MNTESSILQVPIEDIVPNRFQPRKVFDEAALQELADSIKEHGIIQPLVLRRVADKYEIIAGERRYRAAQKVGLMTVPAIIANLTDEQSAEVAIVENVQRRNLTAIEEAKSFKSILDKGYTTQEELARKLGVSQSAISNKLRLLSLDEEVQNAVIEAKISERHARSLLKISDHEKQKQLLNRIITERLTVKQLDTEIKKELESMPGAANANNDGVLDDTPKMPANFIEKPITQAEDLNGYLKMNKTSEEEKVPNKFFNYLEDYSANMNMPESNESMVDIFNVNPQNPTENIQEDFKDSSNDDSNETGNKFFSFSVEADEDKVDNQVNNVGNFPSDFSEQTALPRENPSEYNDSQNINDIQPNTIAVSEPLDEIEMLDDFMDSPAVESLSSDTVLTNAVNYSEQSDPFINIKEFLSFDPKLTYIEYTDAKGKHLEISVKNN